MSSRQTRKDRQREKEIKNMHLALICWTMGNITIEGTPTLFPQYRSFLSPLIALVVVTIFITIPETFVEIGMAQYSRRGCLKVWDAAPVWRGIGILSVISVFLTSIRSFQLCSYLLVYTLNSMRAVSPWMHCGDSQEYLSYGCYSFGKNRTSHEKCIEAFNVEHCNDIEWIDSEQLFWRSIAVTDLASLELQYKFELILCSFLTLIAVYICIRNSMVSFSIFLPFLVYAPAVMQGILLVKSFTHPGSRLALKFICTFSTEEFSSADVWNYICSFGLISINNMGGLKTLGKDTYFRHPTNSVAVLLNLICTTYILLYTAFLFNLMGTFSFEMNKDYNILLKSIKNFNFIDAASSIRLWDLSTMYSFFFFFSNFLIVFRNFAMQLEVLLSSLYELRSRFKRFNNTCCFVLCSVHFVIFIILKLFLSEIFVNAVFHKLVIILTLILAVYSGIFLCFFYGTQRFVDDIHFMLGFKPTIIWQMGWYIETFVYFNCFVYFYSEFIETTDNYLISLLVITTLLSALPLTYFIVLTIVEWQKKQSIVGIFKPTKDWGPDDEILKRSRDMFSAQDMTKEYLYRQQRLKQNISNASGSSYGVTSVSTSI